MSRSVQDFAQAFKVVTQSTNLSGRVGRRVQGPYATVSAAKGRLTRELESIERFSSRYVQDGVKMEAWIEQSTGPWERLES